MNQPRIIAIALLLHAAVASADDTAESALERGNAALKAGRIHEACEAFETSVKLDASVETELRLASCYEQDGKPMAAARLYRSLVDKDPNAARRQRSIAKAAKLEANAPKLRFAINPQPPGLVIKVDGVEVPATGDVLVDQGPHEVIATAPGYAGRASAPVDRDRVIIDVIIRMEPVAEAPEQTMPAARPTNPPLPRATPSTTELSTTPMRTAALAAIRQPARDHRKRNGIVLGVGGLAMLAGSAGLFILSIDKFDDEHALCPMSRCANNDDLAKAESLLSDGRALRGVSYGVGIGGVALVAVGTYLVLTPRKQESPVSVHLQPGGAAIGYTARF
jgi:tetratricopeptide (TPR) repeat protein